MRNIIKKFFGAKGDQKLYFLFAGEHYYPRRGAEDFVSTSTSIEELKQQAEQLYGKPLKNFGHKDIDTAKVEWMQIAVLEDGQLQPVLYWTWDYDGEYWRSY